MDTTSNNKTMKLTWEEIQIKKRYKIIVNPVTPETVTKFVWDTSHQNHAIALSERRRYLKTRWLTPLPSWIQIATITIKH
jgi:hypothetical protein